MSICKACRLLFCLTLVCALYPLSARANDWNQMTEMTFSGPVQIPGKTLPAGSYWFVVQDSQSDRDLVRIFNADWSKVDATLDTVSTYRHQATDDTQVEFAERPHNQPEALLKWYFPGRLTGHELLYSTRHEKEFTRDAKRYDEAHPASLVSRSSTLHP